MFSAFWVAVSFGPANADQAVPIVPLEKIFSRMNAIHTLSYHTKVQSPAGSTLRAKIWIKGNKVKADGGWLKTGQIGKRGYQYSNNQWVESPGLSTNTVLTFLKEAQGADDTKIIGGQTINGSETTIITYTQPRWDKSSNVIKVKLWVSNKDLVPIKIQATNITRNKVQTEEISDISFEDIDDTVFAGILKAEEQAKHRAKEKWKSWQEEREKLYQRALAVDDDQRFTPERKEDFWKSTLSAMCRNNPYSDRDDEMRSHARSRILYWMDKKPISAPKPAPVSPRAGDKKKAHDSRFIPRANGVVEDTATGLEWIAWLDVDTNWNDAQIWVKSLTVDDGGWRMPTREELIKLYVRGAARNNMTPFLKTSGFSVWSGEKKGETTVWQVDFFGGRTGYRVLPVDCNHCTFTRAFAVRSKRSE